MNEKAFQGVRLQEVACGQADPGVTRRGIRPAIMDEETHLNFMEGQQMANEVLPDKTGCPITATSLQPPNHRAWSAPGSRWPLSWPPIAPDTEEVSRKYQSLEIAPVHIIVVLRLFFYL